MGGIVDIMGLPVNAINERELRGLVQSYMTSDAINVIYMVSIGTLKSIVEDQEYRKDVAEDAALILPAEDIILSRVQRKKVRGAVNSYRSLLRVIGELCKNKKVYVIGESHKDTELFIQLFSKRNPDADMCGMYSMDAGYNDESVINDINTKVPDVLFLIFKSPELENWIAENKSKLNSKLLVGVGNISDDMIMQNMKPAKWIKKFGIENLYFNIVKRKYMDNKRKERILDSLLAEYNKENS